MNTDQIGANRDRSLWLGGTASVISLESAPLGSLEITTAGVKCDGVITAFLDVGTSREGSGRKKYTETPAPKATKRMTFLRNEDFR